jgi:broad specificity phosphatase PhoE
MNKRLVLISHAATAAMRAGAFPADEPLDPRGMAETEASRERLAISAAAQAISSPAACALDTARALGLTVQLAPELGDVAYGQWRGRRLAELAADWPAELAAWTRDPQAAPPGGESFSQLLGRVGRWLETLGASDGAASIVALTHAPVIRAALIHVLNAPPASFINIEIAPLAPVELRHSPRGWAWWPARS